MHNWTVGCIQREVFTEHIESQPKGHVFAQHLHGKHKSYTECGGQKGIFSNLSQPLWGDGSFKVFWNISARLSSSEMDMECFSVSFCFFSSSTNPGILRGLGLIPGSRCLEPGQLSGAGWWGEEESPLAVLRTGPTALCT